MSETKENTVQSPNPTIDKAADPAVETPAVETKAATAPKPVRRTTTRRAPRKPAATSPVVAEPTPTVAKPLPDVDDPALYINREISWIEFDRKVLETAADPTVPLLERVKFLSIFFNNLDEFYMVRVMNLQRQARSGAESTGADKMPPTQQLAEIRRKVTDMLDVAEKLWLKTLKPALEEKDIKFGRYADLPKKRRTALDRYFDSEIFEPSCISMGKKTKPMHGYA